jgi:hypothetical protein
MLLRFSLLIIVLALSCSHGQRTPSASQNNVVSPTPEPQSSATPNVGNQPIRSVDFCKVGFPHYPVYSDRRTKYITLKLGTDCGVEPTYGDVTGDGVEEAMVSLGIENRGSAVLEIVYIFSLVDGRPKVLWFFEPGDRGQGGLRRTYAENGNLVVELNGKNAYVGMPNYDDSANCAACDAYYTRSRYVWQNNYFQRVGNLEVFANEGGVR